jgi:histone deacetylase complex regulatory component SIN3
MDIDLSPDEVTMLVKMNGVPSKISSCYLCSLDGDDAGNDLRLHMAEHLRSFALASIPWSALASSQSDNDSKSALAGERSRAGNSSTARMEDFMDEIELSFDHGEQAESPLERDNDLRNAACLLVSDEHERNASTILWNQVQPEPRSSMLDPNSHGGAVKPPILNDALGYIDQVKAHYADRPDVYQSFLVIMKEFKSGAIDTAGVIQRIRRLFSGNHQMIQSFNAFIPQDYWTGSGTETGVDDSDMGVSSVVNSGAESIPQSPEPKSTNSIEPLLFDDQAWQEADPAEILAR